jgi:hypothetical protein
VSAGLYGFFFEARLALQINAHFLPQDQLHAVLHGPFAPVLKDVTLYAPCALIEGSVLVDTAGDCEWLVVWSDWHSVCMFFSPFV